MGVNSRVHQKDIVRHGEVDADTSGLDHSLAGFNHPSTDDELSKR